MDPVQVNTTIIASADFTDPNTSDTHTAEWDWGDGSATPGTVTEADGSGSVMDTHSYAEAGVYTITLTVTDNGGLSDSEVFQFVVVYDPDGGFVTGGGWIDSPAGAYPADPTLTGKANFGFVSKYQHGAQVPTGETEFQFKVADLNFHSTSYDWLVIAGAKAMYKGAGTVNGEAGYTFQLNAINGQVNGGGGVDKFWIKIKQTGSGVIYDNQLGAGDNDDPTTAIGGGNIKIHSGGNGNGGNKAGSDAMNSALVSEELPKEFALHENYPNPFNPVTTIHYELSAAEHVTLRVYDALGRVVATLVDGSKAAGRYDVTFEAGELPSGVYLYRLTAGSFVEARHLVLVK